MGPETAQPSRPNSPAELYTYLSKESKKVEKGIERISGRLTLALTVGKLDFARHSTIPSRKPYGFMV